MKVTGVSLSHSSQVRQGQPSLQNPALSTLLMSLKLVEVCMYPTTLLTPESPSALHLTPPPRALCTEIWLLLKFHLPCSWWRNPTRSPSHPKWKHTNRERPYKYKRWPVSQITCRAGSTQGDYLWTLHSLFIFPFLSFPGFLFTSHYNYLTINYPLIQSAK